MNAGFFSRDELHDLGVETTGADPQVHRTAQIFGGGHLSLGSGARIDCFTVISAGPGAVVLGDGVHLGVGTGLLGTAGIRIGDFVSLSPRATVFSTSDDFRGPYLAGPLVPDELRNVRAEEVRVADLAIVGAGSVVLPGVAIGRGAAVGALSLVKRDVGDGELVAGSPAIKIGMRDLEEITELERRLRAGS